MSLAKNLTPKDTEEMKPGLFIQKKGDTYRQVEPLAWDGKIRWKEQIATVFSVRTIMGLAVIIFIAWAYVNDTSELQQFNQYVIDNPVEYCAEALKGVNLNNQQNDGSSVYQEIEVNNEYTNNIQDNS